MIGIGGGCFPCWQRRLRRVYWLYQL